MATNDDPVPAGAAAAPAAPAAAARCPEPTRVPDARDLVGLALSGGGIRSASFNLGVLQGLASRDTLWIFDYLSTVSGGGFVGAWWSAWLSRETRARRDVFPQEEELEPTRRADTAVLLVGDERARPMADVPDGSRIARRRDPIHFLRLFSNYLTPRAGAFSPDTWRLIAFFTRNLLFTWLVLLPLILAAMMAGQAFFVSNERVARAFLCPAAEGAVATTAPPAAATLSRTAAAASTFCEEARFDRATSLRVRARYLALPFVLLAAAYVTFSILWLAHSSARLGLTFASLALVGGLAFVLVPTVGNGSDWVLEKWGALLVAGACVLFHGVQSFRGYQRPANGQGVVSATSADHRGWLSKQQTWVLRFIVCVGGLLLVAGFGYDVAVWLFGGGASVSGRLLAKAGGWGGLLAAVGSAIYTGVKAAPSTDGTVAAPPSRLGQVVIAIAPPLVLVMLLLGAASAGRWLLAFSIDRPPQGRLLWMATLVVWIAVLELVYAAFESFHDPAMPPKAGPFWTRLVPDRVLKLLGRARDTEAGARMPWFYLFSPRSWVRIAAAAGLGVVIALLPDVSFESLGHALSSTHVSLVAAIVLASGGLMTFARREWRIALGSARPAVLLAFASASATLALAGTEFLARPKNDPFLCALLWLALLVGAVICTGWLVDPNLLSLHGFYKGRLSRAYLGASNTARRNEEITDSAPGDDLPLTALWNHDAGGPYHLVNTTLSLVGASDLATSQRSAENFVLSRYHCGSARAGYRCTAEYMGGQLSLATAAAISGAAISPNMGSKTPSAALSLLLSLMNLRLGFWAPTPSGRRWSEPQARLWPFYVLRETLSNTGQIGTYCYLTDGGHFDNTGLYALVERGCRFVVVSDCGADPALGFEDIGTAIRRCRIDFGAEIDLRIDDFARDAATRRATAHVAWGTIRYQPEHLLSLRLPVDQADGVIVWIKPSVTASNAADVLQYHRAKSDFPQQSTADQWYDESQFESYRRLGYESARAAFAAAASPAAGPPLLPGAFSAIAPWFQEQERAARMA